MKISKRKTVSPHGLDGNHLLRGRGCCACIIDKKIRGIWGY